MSTPQSIGNNSLTVLSFDTEDLDDFGWHAGGSPTLITPTIAGWYRVTLSSSWQGDTDYTRILVLLEKNSAGTTPSRRSDQGLRLTSSTHEIPAAWPLVQMNGSSDNFRIQVLQANTSTGSNTVDACLLVELVVPT
jgi:hypothetical protein